MTDHEEAYQSKPLPQCVQWAGNDHQMEHEIRAGRQRKRIRGPPIHYKAVEFWATEYWQRCKISFIKPGFDILHPPLPQQAHVASQGINPPGLNGTPSRAISSPKPSVYSVGMIALLHQVPFYSSNNVAQPSEGQSSSRFCPAGYAVTRNERWLYTLETVFRFTRITPNIPSSVQSYLPDSTS